ncbi:MAG: PIN domain-containing protein [Flavobacteriales bacterium]|jgi:predicted nucleic acid-binding protein|nr:PIN domain-containing protein [Flavobacteriales bacterium]
MRLFLDTNVLFDLFGTSRPFHIDSLGLVAQGIAGNVELVVTSSSVMTLVYSLGRYKLPQKELVERLNLLLPSMDIAPTSVTELLAGLNSDWSDLEDAIQFHSALAFGGIDAIVSNDKDFKQQKLVPVLTPKQALKRVK